MAPPDDDDDDDDNNDESAAGPPPPPTPLALVPLPAPEPRAAIAANLSLLTVGGVAAVVVAVVDVVPVELDVTSGAVVAGTTDDRALRAANLSRLGGGGCCCEEGVVVVLVVLVVAVAVATAGPLVVDSSGSSGPLESC